MSISKEWNKTLPLRADASDEQIAARAAHFRTERDEAFVVVKVARELASAGILEVRREAVLSADAKHQMWLDVVRQRDNALDALAVIHDQVERKERGRCAE